MNSLAARRSCDVLDSVELEHAVAQGLADTLLTRCCLTVRVGPYGRGYLPLALLALTPRLATGLAAASTLSSPPLCPARVGQDKQSQDSSQEQGPHLGACVFVDREAR